MSIPHTPNSTGDLVADAVCFFREVIRPRAEAIDQSTAALGEGLRSLGEQGLLGLRIPREFGGRGLGEIEFRRFQEECARASGCLAFLQTQHQSAGAMLAKCESEELKIRHLPSMASGASLCGIAFSQLRRRSEKPVLSAKQVHGGYELTGDAPWLTGIGFFENCVTAATTEGGETMFVIHSLENGQNGLAFSQPMKLASMEPAQTVSARFVDYFVPSDQMLYVKPGNWIENNDMINIALQSPFALGCARASLDVIEANFEKKALPAMGAALEALRIELDHCRSEAYAAMDARADTARSLAARGWAVELALRCSATAVVTSSGAGNSLKHPAQRIYREALVFAVSAQTADTMEATLSCLSRTSA